MLFKYSSLYEVLIWRCFLKFFVAKNGGVLKSHHIASLLFLIGFEVIISSKLSDQRVVDNM